jgi:D-alanyl-D-alanine carboxypeptidase/D-alanyl-D-alanine-endopeptidase (penicillin-binding protein 4)
MQVLLRPIPPKVFFSGHFCLQRSDTMKRSLLYRRSRSLAALAIAAAASAATPPSPAPTAIETKIKALVTSGTVMLNDENGAPLLSIDAEKLYIPASIIKILTSQIALDLLGPEYRFKTECYFDSAAGLTIKGFGDPYFVSDEIRCFAKALRGAGIVTVKKLRLDHSYFAGELSIPGISTTNNPYDALNGSLVVNFNTINIAKDAAGMVTSAEAETPLTPLAQLKAAALPRGSTQRINLSARREDCRKYAGELLYAILREQGIDVADSLAGETVTDAGRSPTFTYNNSKPLTEVLRGLLRYSNNFVANQIFLQIGALKNGAPATMEKGIAVYEEYIRTGLKIPDRELTMAEGSGISRDNRVTGRTMIAVVERFKPYADLLTPKNGHPLKSGTLTGVSNYAGYIRTARGLRSFVIILNQEKNTRDAILKLLEAY